MQKSIRPKTKKLWSSTRVGTTAIFRYGQKTLEIHERTDKRQKDTSESIGNSCQNSHTSKSGGGENDDMDKKWKCVKTIGFSCINWKVSILKKIGSLHERRSLEEFLRRASLIYNKYSYNLERLYESFALRLHYSSSRLFYGVAVQAYSSWRNSLVETHPPPRFTRPWQSEL